MNHDHIILAMLLLGGIVGFFLGYSKGHDHGKIAGRIAYARHSVSSSRLVDERP